MLRKLSLDDICGIIQVPQEMAVKLSRRKAELFKQKDAFYLFKMMGIEKASLFYPEYILFMLENKHKTFEAIERELDAEISRLSTCIA